MAPGSTLAMTFYLPMELLDEEDRPMQAMAEKGAREAGTPFVSFFAPDEILVMASKAGFKNATIISTRDMEERYFKDRTDNLLPASGEVFLLAMTQTQAGVCIAPGVPVHRQRCSAKKGVEIELSSMQYVTYSSIHSTETT